jgi:hypothetical protein
MRNNCNLMLLGRIYPVAGPSERSAGPRCPIPKPSPCTFTVIGGDRLADDFEVIWRSLPIGRIMRASGDWIWARNHEN